MSSKRKRLPGRIDEAKRRSMCWSLASGHLDGIIVEDGDGRRAVEDESKSSAATCTTSLERVTWKSTSMLQLFRVTRIAHAC